MAKWYMNKWLIGTIAVVVLLVVYYKYQDAQPGEYDAFAQCLADNGATFYGAYWCPHCQDQKEMFGRSRKLLPYVECSLANRAGSTQACIQANVSAYPTWEFKDGSREVRVMSLFELAQKTGCQP